MSSKKRSCTTSFRLKVVEIAEKNGKHFVAKAFEVDRKTVH